MQKIAVGILGAAALAVSVMALRVPRQQARTWQEDDTLTIPAGERVPGQVSLDRIRELGF